MIEIINNKRNTKYSYVLIKIITVHFFIIGFLFINNSFKYVTKEKNKEIQRIEKENQLKEEKLQNSKKHLESAIDYYKQKDFDNTVYYFKLSLEADFNKNNFYEYLKFYNSVLIEGNCEIINSNNLSKAELLTLIKKYVSLKYSQNITLESELIGSIQKTFDFQVLKGMKTDNDDNIEMLLNIVSWKDLNNKEIIFKSKSFKLMGKVEYLTEPKQSGYYSIKKGDIYISFGSKNFSGKLTKDGTITTDFGTFKENLSCK